MSTPDAGVTVAVAAAAGAFGQIVARHLRIPGVVLLLMLGVTLGPEVLGWVRPDELGANLGWIVELAVVVVLFEGGLSLELSRLRRQESAIRWLVTVGALITLAGGALAAHGVLGWSWATSALFGSLVVVTGPTVVAPIVRSLRLKPRLKTVLEAEGVLIDPVGAFVAALVLQIVLVPGTATVAVESQALLVRLAIGLGAGLAGGFAIGWSLRHHVIPHGLENVFGLGAIVGLFQLCELGASHAGILAITVAGVVVGNMGLEDERSLREFKEELTVLLVGLLFVLLAADVRLADVAALGAGGAGVVAALVFVVRPAAVLLCMRGSACELRERLFVAAIAPRGIVAAAVASITVSALESSGVVDPAESSALKALVFLTIASTVLLAGLVARPLADLLSVRLPNRDRVAILGAQGLGLELGRVLVDAGRSVVFLDSDPVRCRRAEELGFSVVFGDALEERVMARAQFELVGTVIGLTPNDHLNSLFTVRAGEDFEVPQLLVAVRSMDGSALPGHLARTADVVFDGPHDAARWDVRARHGSLKIERFVRTPASADEAATDETPVPWSRTDRFVVLAVGEGEQLEPMTAGTGRELGDDAILTIASYEPERDQALERLAELGWEPAPNEPGRAP